MPIKIVPEGALYNAEVTPPQGNWRSPHPMRSDDLARKLLSIGCRSPEIAQALREAGVQSFSGYYQKVAEETITLLKAALAGEYEPLPQSPFTEVWMAYALFLDAKTPITLEEIIASADSIEHSVPSPDEIVWAFLRLRKRGWLAEQNNLYELTTEGRRTINEIVGKGGTWDRIDRLKEWISAHPPPDHS